MHKRDYPEWAATLRVGDVLKSASGTYRVVRRVHYRHGLPHTVYFTIRRRSWTRRCYTIYSVTELLAHGFCHVGARLQLKSSLDTQIANAIDRVDYPITWRDVQGVA